MSEFPEMDVQTSLTEAADSSSTSALGDWSNLRHRVTDDDDRLILPRDSADTDPEPQPKPPVSNLDLQAGPIPSSCAETDEKLKEEEAGLLGSKQARCQVGGCEVDISELKGYYKRHRICLRCAYASSVLVDGESKRYCRQCGKFQELSEFDEGKRSCRRKLKHHIKRPTRRLRVVSEVASVSSSPSEDGKA